MTKTRNLIFVLAVLLCSAAYADDQVRIGIGLPYLNIGVNLNRYPDLVAVPGYPVYYAPGVNANYFFYDGLYWVYQNDNWYASSWYNGPWSFVDPLAVPAIVLQVPVAYYRRPPAYFRGWRVDAPPRWNYHWGRDWDSRRSDWNRWDARAARSAAPLPLYQREYPQDRYPRRLEQQRALQDRSYRYQPRDAMVRQHYGRRPAQNVPPTRSKRTRRDDGDRR
ncbi:MAG: hypothetical protein LJE59_04920 [Chromatiaceae bacterium]|jgi:hypothetical protein|nr:hypothetical protein [Chromatiaceae bacterium]